MTLAFCEVKQLGCISARSVVSERRLDYEQFKVIWSEIQGLVCCEAVGTAARLGRGDRSAPQGGL
jgi:hypothetical protein